MPFDFALAEAIKQAEMRPAIVQPFDQADTKSVAALRDKFWPMVDAKQRAFRQWQADLEAGKAILSRQFEETLALGVASEAELQPIDVGIEQLEATARARALEYDKVARTFRQHQRAAARRGSELRHWVDKIAEAALTEMSAELEERGDFLLFLKSWRAELAGGRAEAPAFGSSDDLLTYLRAKIAL